MHANLNSACKTSCLSCQCDAVIYGYMYLSPVCKMTTLTSEQVFIKFPLIFI